MKALLILAGVLAGIGLVIGAAYLVITEAILRVGT